MKFHRTEPELDPIDLALLELLQENCKRSLAALGEKVGLSAPSVLERVHKMEEAGIIQGYTALLNGRRLGKDVTAFIGASVSHETSVEAFAREVTGIPDVLECHHVTGNYTLLLKVKVADTQALKRLIDRVRAMEGVARTETMVVLSTQAERTRIALQREEVVALERSRRGGPRRPLRRAESASR